MTPVVALLLLSACSHQNESLPDTLAGKRLSEFIVAFNTKDIKQVESMVTRNFAKSTLRVVSKEEWTNRITSAFELAPISVKKILQSTDSTITVLLKANTQFPLGIRLDLEPDQPYGIAGARMGDPKDLASNATPKKFANWKELADLAELVRREYKLPGLILSYEKLGQKRQDASAGLKNSQETDLIDTTDRVSIGGVGKVLTATLIARLIELKKLNWNTTLATALPNIEILDAYRGITVEQLLKGNTGIPQNLPLTSDQLEQMASKSQNPTDIRRQFVSSILSSERGNLEGNLNNDSKAEYVVAGYIAERIIGKSYEWLLQRYVLDPMKLTSVLISPLGSDGQVGSLGNIFGHLQSDLGYTPYLPPASKLDFMLAPAGSCVTCTIADLIRLGEFNLRGVIGDADVVSAESYAKLHGLNGNKGMMGGWIKAPGDDQIETISVNTGSFSVDLAIYPKDKQVFAVVINAGVVRQPTPGSQAIQALRDKLTASH